MNPCTIKRGIFSLRECANAATDACSQCGAAICQEHTLYLEGKIFCTGCRGESAGTPQAKGAANPGNVDYGRPGWSQNWRDDYYRDYSYRPFYYGYGYYDDADRSGFSLDGRGDPLNENDQAAGFSDS